LKKIYVASSWRNSHQPEVVAALRYAGFSVYDFRNPEPGNVGFKWSDVDPEWTDKTLIEPVKLIEGLNHPTAIRGYEMDMRSLMDCDACVLVLPSGRSAHLEAGFAVGAGKPTVIYMPERQEPEVMYRITQAICTHMDDVIFHLRVGLGLL
jgi:nucleoside 2-deoxyribosyltransferase